MHDPLALKDFRMAKDFGEPEALRAGGKSPVTSRWTESKIM